MTARQQALSDIRKSLKSEGKRFIPFRKELNKVMNQLVQDYDRTRRFLYCGKV